MKTLKQSYINDTPIAFSYTKKYQINYGHKLVDNSAGTFKGKVFGIGVYKIEKAWHDFVHIVEKDQHYAIYFSDITLTA